MNHKNSLISFDVDMTLLNHKDFKIPESAMRAVNLLRKDHYIVIGSGRNMDNSYSVPVRDEIAPDGIIHMNGARISVGNDVIYEQWMNPETISRLVAYARGREFAVGITMDGIDYFCNQEYVVRHDMNRWKESNRRFGPVEYLIEHGTHSLAYIGYEDVLRDVEREFPELKFPMFSSKQGADVIEVGISKADGLKRLADYFEVDMKDTIAFGDSMNDYEIVKAAGIGIAMGNAVEGLKQVADYVTDDIGNDGVWKACVSLHLLDTNEKER